MSDILDLIDGALRDNGTSTDAIRWTPEPAAEPAHPFDEWLEQFAAEQPAGRTGIITAPLAAPPREDGRTMLDDIRDLSQRIMQDPYDQPLPARIEVDNVALAALRTLAVERTRPPWAGVIGDPFGIPIHINPDLPRGGWRVIDSDANVLNEGTVVPSVTCPGDCDQRAGTGRIAPWRGRRHGVRRMSDVPAGRA